MTNPMIAGLRPMHPGELLREDILPAVARPKAAIARMLGLSRQHLHDILTEKKPVTAATALKLEKLFGSTAATWLRLQNEYDLRTLQPAMAAELDRIERLEAA